MASVVNVLYGPSKQFQVDGVDVGFTMTGTEIQHNVTAKDIEADQVVGVVRKMKTKEEYVVKTTFLESSLRNLQLAIGLTTPPVLDGSNNLILYVGVQRLFVDHTLYIVGQAPGGFERQVTCRIAESFAATKLDFKKDGEEAFTVQFALLPDFSQAAGQEYLQILDSATARY